MIPFSVALEDRLSKMSEEEAAEELKKLGTKSALPRIAVSGIYPHRLCPLAVTILLWETSLSVVFLYFVANLPFLCLLQISLGQ